MIAACMKNREKAFYQIKMKTKTTI